MCDQNDLCFSHTFEIFIPCFLTIFFREVNAHVIPNAPTNGFLKGKKPEKVSLWGYCSKGKKDECNQSNLGFLDDFDRFIPWATIFFLEVCAGVSMKLTTNGSFWNKQISRVSIFEVITLKQNEGVRPK